MAEPAGERRRSAARVAAGALALLAVALVALSAGLYRGWAKSKEVRRAREAARFSAARAANPVTREHSPGGLEKAAAIEREAEAAMARRDQDLAILGFKAAELAYDAAIREARERRDRTRIHAEAAARALQAEEERRLAQEAQLELMKAQQAALAAIRREDEEASRRHEAALVRALLRDAIPDRPLCAVSAETYVHTRETVAEARGSGVVLEGGRLVTAARLVRPWKDDAPARARLEQLKLAPLDYVQANVPQPRPPRPEPLAGVGRTPAEPGWRRLDTLRGTCRILAISRSDGVALIEAPGAGPTPATLATAGPAAGAAVTVADAESWLEDHEGTVEAPGERSFTVRLARRARRDVPILGAAVLDGDRRVLGIVIDADGPALRCAPASVIQEVIEATTTSAAAR